VGNLLPLAGPATFTNDDAFLNYLEQQTFNFFLNETNATSGLLSDKSAPGWPCAIGGVGFGLSATAVAVERGWISRSDGAARVLNTLQTFYHLPQGSGATGYAGYRGWFYHLLDAATGLRDGLSELSTIDTALLMMGVIDAGQFFNNPTNFTEIQIRQFADALVNRLDWTFVLRTNDNTVTLQWTPEAGFADSGWSGYSEASCLYLMGLGMASNPLPVASWSAWTNRYQWNTFYGYSFVQCAPLFTHQYSHIWVDFRNITDAYMRGQGSDYFENSRRATLAQQQYAAQNPGGYPNYSASEWGLTSCDGPNLTTNGITSLAYVSRGAPLGFDDGTIAPTAMGGSLPFAPEVCLPGLSNIYQAYTTNLWTTEGFRDAYNIQAGNWFDPLAIGLDQGPILLMIENYRTGSTWSRMLRSPIIQQGLQRAGFTAPPPDQLTATALAGNQLRLSWNNNSTYQTGFQVEVSTDQVNFSVAATVAAGVTNLVVPAAPGTWYFFRVRTTSAAGLSGFRQVIAAISSPQATVNTPADGTILTVPAALTLGAVVITNGRAVNAVQFYANETNLLGVAVGVPYNCSWSNVPAGTYSVRAQVLFDGTNTVDSPAIRVFVTVPGAPSAPQNLRATAAPGRILVNWSPVAAATGYLLSRDGVGIAALAGTSYLDTGRDAGTTSCYTVLATNSAGNSAPSSAACATTPVQGTSLIWDADPSLTSAQDGSGNWSGGTANWWSGTSTIGWFDDNLAVFGVATASNLNVAVIGDVSPSAITFNNTPGSYVLTGGGSIQLSNTITISAAGNAMITAPLRGVGGFIKAGDGCLTLMGDNTYRGLTSLNAGTLAIHGQHSLGSSSNLVLNGGSLSLRGTAIDMPLAVNGGSIEYLGGFGSNILDGLITLSAASVTFNSSWSDGMLSLEGGVFGPNNNLELLNDGGFANIWIRRAPLNLGNGQLSGYGWHLAVAGNIVGTIHPYYGRSTYLETDNAFTGTPNLVIGNPSWGQLDLNGHSLAVSSLSNPANNGTADVVTSTPAATLTVSNNADCSYGGLLSGAGLALAKGGSGTLTLSGTATYGGNTLLNGGTLALRAPAGTGSPIPNSPVLCISPGACLDLSGVVSGFSLGDGQTLEGAGAVKGNCNLDNGSSLIPGNSIGTLTFSDSLTLLAGSQTVMKLSTTPKTNDLLLVSGTLAFGGTLVVTNSGPLALSEGDSFQLFSAGTFSGQFSSLQLVSPGRGLAWDTSLLASRGILKVISIKPRFGSCRLSGTNFVALGFDGPPNGAYVALCSTNLNLPASQWIPWATNYFDANGDFGFTNSFNASPGGRFFRLQLQ